MKKLSLKRSIPSFGLLILPLAVGLFVGSTSTSAQTPLSPQELNLASKIGFTCNVRSHNGDDGDSTFGILTVVNDKWIVLNRTDPATSPKHKPRTYQTWIPADQVTSVEFIENGK